MYHDEKRYKIMLIISLKVKFTVLVVSDSFFKFHISVAKI
jgi:hypothetical protein